MIQHKKKIKAFDLKHPSSSSKNNIMGNYISCSFIAPNLNLRSPKSARAILPGGEVRQFRQPVKAAELMLECPNHFVVNSKSLTINRRFSPLLADEELEFGNLYVMFPMRRVNSVVTAADVAVFLMAAPRRISGGNAARISAEVASEESDHPDGRTRLMGLESSVEPEFTYRLVVSRSRRPMLDTITEEPVSVK